MSRQRSAARQNWTLDRVHQALITQLEPSVARVIRIVGEVAHSRGTKAWLVGGIVRDAVLGIQSQHQVPDIVIAGDVHDFANDCMKRSGESSLLARSEFQTCRIQLDGHAIELAAARKDTYAPHGALPAIEPVPHILDDLPRRDFSINAMAVELIPTGFGEFYDPYRGLEDCANLTLRALHRDAFSEDPTRILRGIRLAARYSLRFDPDTSAHLTDALPDLTAFHSKSPGRLFNELARWFDPHENLHKIASMAKELGVTQALHMGPLTKTKTDALSRLPDSCDSDTKFATFLQILDQDTLQTFFQNMPLTKKWLALLDGTVRFRRVFPLTDWDALSDSEVASKLRTYDAAVVSAAAIVMCNRPLGGRIQRLNEAARHTKPLIDGREVAKLGITDGPEIGDTIREIVNRRIDGQIATRADEVSYVRGRIQHNAANPS